MQMKQLSIALPGEIAVISPQRVRACRQTAGVDEGPFQRASLAFAPSPPQSGCGLTTLTSGRWVYSQYPPQRGPVSNPQIERFLQSYSLPLVHLLQTLQDMFPCETILSPTLICFTSSPIAVTSPAASVPEMWGKGIARGFPRIPQISS